MCLAVLLPALALAPGCRNRDRTQVPSADAADALPPELAASIAALDEAVEAERVRVGTPAAALLVVKDGKVVFAGGYGKRGAGSEPEAEVDADTVFAIGSITKSFTAMLVMMAVEQGVLKLEDHPRTCLPEFTLADPEAANKVTLRDLLTHRTGLGRTDLAWYAGGLTRDELLQVAYQAQPMAPLGTQTHYNNLMYVAAGECAAKALEGTYEALVAERIFAPLGMNGASIDAASLRDADNHAQGHARTGPDRVATPVPVKTIDPVAPAGSINASVTTMAPWLQLMLGGGAVGQTRLVSAATFERIVSPHAAMGPGVEYGLGWVLDQWRGQRRVWHNGGIDGYYALVSMLPEHDIGFVLLTADDSADLEDFVTDRVFELAVPADDQPASNAAAEHVGTYGIVGGFQATVATDPDTGVTTITVPDQPPYPLVAGEQTDRFALGSPAPSGFFATFAGDGEDKTLTIAQPQGTISLPWLPEKTLAAAREADVPEALRPMLGAYRHESGLTVTLLASQGRVALSAAGQAPAPLVATDDPTKFTLDGLPPSFTVTVDRGKRGRVDGIALGQPQGDISLSRVPGTEPIETPLPQLWKEIAKAHGSAAMAGHDTLEVVSRVELVHQGVQATATTRRASDDRFAETLALTAVGKPLGTIDVGHAAGKAWERSSFSPPADPSALEAESLALQAAFDPWGAPLAGFADATIMRVDALPNEDEPVIVIRRRTASGITWVDMIGRRTKLLKMRTTTIPGTDGAPDTIEVQRFADYREAGGVQIPHRVEASTHNGTVTSVVQSVHFDARLPADAFSPPASADRR